VAKKMAAASGSNEAATSSGNIRWKFAEVDKGRLKVTKPRHVLGARGFRRLKSPPRFAVAFGDASDGGDAAHRIAPCRRGVGALSVAATPTCKTPAPPPRLRIFPTRNAERMFYCYLSTHFFSFFDLNNCSMKFFEKTFSNLLTTLHDF
jgi:hypothetical protein